MIDQAQFMRKFNETHREEFESDLFKRDNHDIVNSLYQLLKSFQFLNSMDKMLKTGQLCDMEDLIDFVICKVLTV